jgi:hypothetical protein
MARLSSLFGSAKPAVNCLRGWNGFRGDEQPLEGFGCAISRTWAVSGLFHSELSYVVVMMLPKHRTPMNTGGKRAQQPLINGLIYSAA